MISPEEQWYGFSPIEQHLMISVYHLSDAQELARENEELVGRLNQAKAIIIEELEKQRQGRSGP